MVRRYRFVYRKSSFGHRESFGGYRYCTGTLPVAPVQFRCPPKLSRWPKLDFLYRILYLRTISDLLVTSGISSGTPNNFRVSAYSYLYNPSVTEP